MEDPLLDDPMLAQPATDADAEAQKVPKAEVAYGDPPPDHPNQTCQRCTYFAGAYRCKLVRGDVAPTGWCLEWQDGGVNTQVARLNPVAETTTSASVGPGLEGPLGAKPVTIPGVGRGFRPLRIPRIVRSKPKAPRA